MITNRFFLIPAISLGLLFSCDNSGTTETTATSPANETAVEEAVPQEAAEQEVSTETSEEQESPGVNETHELTAQDFKYSPNELRVKPNQRVQVTLINQGDVDYSVKFELPEGEQELRTPVPPGRKAGLVFTTPKKKGTYNFYSPLPNQRGRGMTGTLIVE